MTMEPRPHPASMRPRPEGRGEPELSVNAIRTATRLQCGHDPKAVENREQHRRHSEGVLTLQCGHDPKAVENRSRYKRLISRWLKRALRAGAGCDGKTKQKMLDLIQ